MKKIILAATVAMALSTSGAAFELVSKNENVVVFAGVTNMFEADYFVGTHKHPDSPTAGHTGTKEDAGYSISIGIEDNVKDYNFGSRKTLTFYDDGKYTYGDGRYYEIFTGKGIEISYDVFYKLNTHFKPYLAVGIGMNDGSSKAIQNDASGNEKWSTSGKSQDMTGVIKLGVTGEIIASIEYFAEYKYRAGGESSLVSLSIGTTDLPNAVKHSTVTLGFGYKF